MSTLLAGMLFMALSQSAVTFVSFGPGATEQEIVQMEKKLGTSLPADYREFLRTSNGGKPKSPDSPDVAFPITWNGQEWAYHFKDTVLRHLGTASRGVPQTLQWIYSDQVLAQIRQYMPLDTIPIGEDWGGNPLLIGITGPNRGKVFYWASEFAPSEDGVLPNYGNVGLVANSFTEFLAKLYPLKD
jgi:cell wall assembly regulator SMI1